MCALSSNKTAKAANANCICVQYVWKRWLRLNACMLEAQLMLQRMEGQGLFKKKNVETNTYSPFTAKSDMTCPYLT